MVLTRRQARLLGRPSAAASRGLQTHPILKAVTPNRESLGLKNPLRKTDDGSYLGGVRFSEKKSVRRILARGMRPSEFSPGSDIDEPLADGLSSDSENDEGTEWGDGETGSSDATDSDLTEFLSHTKRSLNFDNAFDDETSSSLSSSDMDNGGLMTRSQWIHFFAAVLATLFAILLHYLGVFDDR